MKLNNSERSELEAKIPELKAAYKAAMNLFLALSSVDVERRRHAFREMHSSGIAYFNAVDRSIVLGSLDGSANNSTWFTDKAETCANLLDIIILHYRTIRQKAPTVGIPCDSLSPSKTAYANIQRIVAQHDPQLAMTLRASIESEGLPTYGFDKEETEPEALRGEHAMGKSTQIITAFLFGVIFIVVLLVLAIEFPHPTEFQYVVFRIVLALAAAGVGAMLPGFIQVDISGWVRAGGALAVFVIVYFYNPASLVVPPPTPRWEKVEVLIQTEGAVGKSIPKAQWTDIFWMGAQGWLCGIIEEGGGGGYVGSGILLRTIDKGTTWSVVPKANFASDQGVFRWRPCAPEEPKESCERRYMYSWNEVGPIKSLEFYKPTGEDNNKGVLAATTGIYITEDNGDHWQRKSPKPGEGSGYAHFFRIATIEGLHEIYAVGWQGIAHWPAHDGGWELQLPTYSHAIFSVFVGPDREIWAVGHAPNLDKRVYQGAIYRLPPRSNVWEQVPFQLPLEYDQSFTDIMLTDHTTAIVIGQKGLILRGVRNEAGDWAWSKVPSGSKETLNSVAFGSDKLWIAGNGGLILYSVDNGKHWTELSEKLKPPGLTANLKRIRFFESTGWIVGDDVVLKLAGQS